jgi:hypothetical protein
MEKKDYLELLTRYAKDVAPLTRYVKNILNMNGEKFTEQKYNEFWKNYDVECIKRNIEHPIEYYKKFEIVGNQAVSVISIGKRKGEDWFCRQSLDKPNGGEGDISIDDAILLIQDKQEIEKINIIRKNNS